MMNELDDRNVDPGICRALAFELATQMLWDIQMPEAWRDHVRKQMVAELLSTPGSAVDRAARVACQELRVLSGLHSGPEFSEELLTATFGHYDQEPAVGMADALGDTQVDDTPTAKLREHIADAMLSIALDGLNLAAGTADRLRPAIIASFDTDDPSNLGQAGKALIRQHVLAATRHDPKFDQAAFERQLAAA
jgi:hypothetical protein